MKPGMLWPCSAGGFVRSPFRLSFLYLFAALVSLLTPSLALAQQLTTTTALSVSPSGSAASGTLLTLTATVTDQNAAAVLYGSITFYDGTTSLRTVQVVSTNTAGFTPGTAIWKTISLAVGSHSLTAKFTATNTDAASASTAQSVTLTGPARSATSLSLSGNSNGNYGLNATVFDAAAPAPSGNVAFTDTTAGTTLGTEALTAGVAGSSAAGLPISVSCRNILSAGDINGDGFDDIIAAGAGCSTGANPSLQIFLGNGDGTFQAARVTALPSGFSPLSINLADFNSDGDIDLLIVGATPSQETFAVFLGNGDGTFQAPIQNNGFTAAINPSAENQTLGIRDVNGDGILDVVYSWLGIDGSTFESATFVGTALGDGTGALHGNGTGELSGPDGPIVSYAAFIPQAGSGFEIAAASSQGILIYSGGSNPGGSYDILSTSPTSLLLVGDMNGDGFADIVAYSTTADGTSLEWSVFLGDGNGNFTLASTPPVPAPPLNGYYSALLVDFNRDGNLDIVSTPSTPVGSLCVTPGNGDGSLSSAQTCNSISTLVSGVISPANFYGFGQGDLLLTVGPFGGFQGTPTNVNGFIEAVTDAAFSSTAGISNVTITPPRTTAGSCCLSGRFTECGKHLRPGYAGRAQSGDDSGGQQPGKRFYFHSGLECNLHRDGGRHCRHHAYRHRSVL
jgi:hypothetical protein